MIRLQVTNILFSHQSTKPHPVPAGAVAFGSVTRGQGRTLRRLHLDFACFGKGITSFPTTSCSTKSSTRSTGSRQTMPQTRKRPPRKSSRPARFASSWSRPSRRSSECWFTDQSSLISSSPPLPMKPEIQELLEAAQEVIRYFHKQNAAKSNTKVPPCEMRLAQAEVFEVAVQPIRITNPQGVSENSSPEQPQCETGQYGNCNPILARRPRTIFVKRSHGCCAFS